MDLSVRKYKTLDSIYGKHSVTICYGTMFWEEKIDRIKRETDVNDFRVPFTDGSTILKRIEAKFIVKVNSNDMYSPWTDRLKKKKKIKDFLTANVADEIDKLDDSHKYWIVLTREIRDSKNLVYDSKPKVITKLIGLWDGDFYIVDKKYHWLAYFKRMQADIEVFKSGDELTPWDKK